MTTIPASLFSEVEPSVVGVAGNALDVNGLILTKNTRVPIGTVASFPDVAAVSSFFGPSDPLVTVAGVYFGGFEGATAVPGAMLVAQYPYAAVSAYLRGGNISALPLTTLQGYSGTLNVTIDGILKTASINLSGATSFSNAAEIIGNDLGIEGVQAGAVTASIGGTFGTCTTTGTTLTLGSVTTGSLWPGDTVTATDGTNTLNTTVVAQLTGTPGGSAGATFSLTAAASPGNLTSSTVTAESSVLHVTAVGSGAVGVADVLSGAGITANTYVASLGTGTGGVGTYNLSGSQQHTTSHTVGSVTAYTPGVLYDSVSGAFVINSGTTGSASTITYGSGALATDLLLTQALGAVTSQGAAVATPATFMNALVNVTTDWVTFMTTFDPDGGSGNTQKQAFAAWKNNYPNRYAYVCWDTDITPTESVPATGSLGYILANNGDSGTCLIYEATDLNLAAFVCGVAASIDFNATAGRTSFAFRQQAGIMASVTDALTAVNLGGNPQVAGSDGNGYNYYGAVGTATTAFTFFQRGFVTGAFDWLDSYINQIYFNAQFQQDMLTLLVNSKSIPYNAAGNSLIEQALAPTIKQGLTFGAWAPGDLDSSQIAAVNNQAGTNIAGVLQSQGWYLQVLPATATVRKSRGSPPCTFWYLDRGSVQALNLASVAVQ